MTTYALFTASYGPNYANLRVRILEAATGVPALVMASAASGILSSQGNALLDGSGNLSVYLDTAKTFQVWNNQFLLIPSGISLATEVQRTIAQLNAAPTTADIGLGLGATFFLDTNPVAQYRISADKTTYTLITGGGGGGAFATITGQPTDNANLATALAAKVGAISRTTAQLAGTPLAGDAAMSAQAQFYDPLQTVDATHPWVYYSATATAYVKIAAGGAATGVAIPQALGTASAGVAAAASHEDHVHPPQTALQTGAIPQVNGTWNAATNTPTYTSGVGPTDGVYARSVSVAGTTLVDGNANWNVNDNIEWNGTAYVRVAANPLDTTKLVKPDGTGGLVSAVPGTDYQIASGYAPPLVLVCGVPIGSKPVGATIGANGAITTAPYPTTYTNIWLRFEVNEIGTGVPADWYLCQFTSGTTGTVFNNTYVPGNNYSAANSWEIPASPTPFSGTTGIGVLVGDSTSRTYASLSIPSGYLGKNGWGSSVMGVRCSATTASKTFRNTLGGSGNLVAVTAGGTSGTTGLWAGMGGFFFNRGNASLQQSSTGISGVPFYVGNTTPQANTTVNTASGSAITFTADGFCGSTSDWFVFEYLNLTANAAAV